jgi:hypothetical protein
MSKRFNVCVVFGERRRMKSAVIYASRLASQLGADALHVYLPSPTAQTQSPIVAGGSAAEIQRARVAQTVQQWQHCPVIVHDDVDLKTARPEQLPPNSIVVSNELALVRRDLTVLHPFDEVQVLRASGSILVPFGDGDSGLIAASLAIPLAKALSLEVLFYHTTWRSETTTSEEPAAHMCVQARAHQQRLQKLAQAAAVPHRMAIEMADDVVFGMLHCALNGGVHRHAEPAPVNLIVMAHGVNTYLGSYVEKALKVSPTPILVAAILTSATPGATPPANEITS